MSKVWIYDLETLNIFTAVFIDRDSNESKHFIYSNDINEIPSLIKFLLTEVSGLIGYNCLHFDSQILEFIIDNPDVSILDIKLYADNIINSNNKIPEYPEYKLRIPHLDLFRALSLSVKAKRTGLKWCEFQMDFDNIEDLPETTDNVEDILSYNYNDVHATKQLYLKNIKTIELRKKLTKRENINLLNSTEPGISKKLFAKWLSESMGISIKHFNNIETTNRPSIHIEDIIFNCIKFKTEKLINVYNTFKNTIHYEGDKLKIESFIGKIPTTFGLGGIHGCLHNRIVESNEEFIIKSLDVKSYYPNLAIRNKLHPKHIPQKVFCDLYESLYEERISIPKSDPRNYVLKICLNALYGLSNDKFSPFRDRQFTITICVNGQLLLTMLFEELLLKIPNSEMLMINTDGGELLIPRIYEKLYHDICKKWEDMTNLVLEFDDYQKLILRDVNNYCGLFSNGYIKTKGVFEFKDIPLHKNKSFSIIAEAVYQYFINGKTIEDTIKNERNIFKFCAGVKSSKSPEKGRSTFELHYIHKGELIKEKLSKTVRYYISNKGKYLMKSYEDGSLNHVEAPKMKKSRKIKDWRVTYFNKAKYYNDFNKYDIDYSYYISKAREWIYELEDKQQLKLF